MQKCRTLNGDQRAALRETREIRRTHETHETDKTYKTQARRSNEQTETDRLQVRTPANARRNQLAGGTATGDCSFAMFAFMAGFSIRFGRSVQEVGWRRQVRFQRRSRPPRARRAAESCPVMTRSAPTLQDARRRARPRVGIQIGECPIVIAGVKPHDGLELDVAADLVCVAAGPEQRGVMAAVMRGTCAIGQSAASADQTMNSPR